MSRRWERSQGGFRVIMTSCLSEFPPQHRAGEPWEPRGMSRGLTPPRFAGQSPREERAAQRGGGHQQRVTLEYLAES